MTGKFLKDEKTLLDAVATGNTRAFTVIYNFYQPRIYSFCLSILHSEQLAEEVVQEALLKLWQMGEKLKGIESLDAYLKTVSRNTAIDLIRRQQLERRVNFENKQGRLDRHNETEEFIILNETRRILDQGIAQLPPQRQLVYRYSNQEGIPIEEVASRLNISTSTAQTHLKLAKRQLRKYLRQYMDISVLALLFHLS